MELYEELQKNHHLFTKQDDEKDWFKLENLPILNSVVLTKPLQATYAAMEILEPEPEIVVYNMSLYNDKGIHVGGAEITQNEIIWD
jgi:hypothetical protein